MELVPRLIRSSGFEWCAGLYVNPTSPEDAAMFPRETQTG